MPVWAGYCGNEIRNSYFEDKQVDLKVRQEIFKHAETFGNFLYREGLFKGFFGFDFSVDMDTHEVFFMEINPRLTGPSALVLQAYEAQGHQFPLFLYHCLEHLGIDINIDIQQLNNEWISLQHYEKNELAFLIMRPMDPSEENIPYDFPAGFWKQEGGAWKHTGKVDFRIQNLEEGEIFFTPNRGYSKVTIIMKELCQDYDFKLTQQSK